MAKRKETIEIEHALYKTCREKRIYGCEEVTIGFHNNGYGNEIVDFMTMDSKGIIKCYEIKVTQQDLKSKAKRSWYGHYNYLVVSNELYNKVHDWNEHIPDHVGLIVASQSRDGRYIISKSKVKKQNIPIETNLMLKESLVRSIFYKMQKYKDAADMNIERQLKKEIKDWKESYNNEREERMKLKFSIQLFERACRKMEGKKIFFEDIVREKLKEAGFI